MLHKIKLFALLGALVLAIGNVKGMEGEEEIFLKNNLCIVNKLIPTKEFYEFSNNPSLSFISVDKLENFIEKTLQKKFSKIHIEKDFLDDNSRKLSLFVHNTEEKIVLFDIISEYKNGNILGQVECRVHDSCINNDLWNYPIKISFWGGKTKVVEELSYEHLIFVTHYRSNLDYEELKFFPSSEVEEKFFNIIKKNGMEESVLRLVLLLKNNIVYILKFNKEKNNSILNEFFY